MRIIADPSDYLRWLREQSEIDEARRELITTSNELRMYVHDLELAEDRWEATHPLTVATLRRMNGNRSL